MAIPKMEKIFTHFISSCHFSSGAPGEKGDRGFDGLPGQRGITGIPGK